MQKEYLTVFHCRTTDPSDDFEQVQSFDLDSATAERRAQELSERLAKDTGRPTYIEWQLVEITRAGRELLDSDASYGGHGNPS